MWNKYKNKKTQVDGILFDSKKEANRYCELRLLLRSGQIQDLRLQEPYLICPSVILNGKKQRPVYYVADFVYTQDGSTVVEDTKGVKTREYIIKRKLMKHVHGIEVKET